MLDGSCSLNSSSWLTYDKQSCLLPAAAGDGLFNTDIMVDWAINSNQRASASQQERRMTDATSGVHGTGWWLGLSETNTTVYCKC